MTDRRPIRSVIGTPAHHASTFPARQYRVRDWRYSCAVHAPCPSTTLADRTVLDDPGELLALPGQRLLRFRQRQASEYTPTLGIDALPAGTLDLNQVQGRPLRDRPARAWWRGLGPCCAAGWLIRQRVRVASAASIAVHAPPFRIPDYVTTGAKEMSEALRIDRQCSSGDGSEATDEARDPG